MRSIFIALTIAAFAFCPVARAATAVTGKPIELFADPVDVVIVLDTAGPCGSRFFEVARAATNFKEFSAIALTALSGGRSMRLFVESCATDRNIVSHGSMF